MGLTEEILTEIDDVVASSRELLRRDQDEAAATRLLALLDRLAKPDSAYHRTAAQAGEGYGEYRAGIYEQAVQALRADIEKGYVRTFVQRVRAGVFEDFLGMAEHLVDVDATHGPPAAAVIAGSVLEDHVRKLTEQNGVDVVDEKGRPRHFEQLSHDLVREGVIGEPERKLLGGWYGQRTEAAHGRFENVLSNEIPRIIAGVREFIVNHPA